MRTPVPVSGIDGLRYLRDDLGDLIRFDAARHAVIGRVTRVIRELEG